MEQEVKHVWFADEVMRGGVARRLQDGESLDAALTRWAMVFNKEFHRPPTTPVVFTIEFVSGRKVCTTVVMDKRKRATIATYETLQSSKREAL